MKTWPHIQKTFLSGLILILPLWVALGLTFFIIKRLTAFVLPWLENITGLFDIVFTPTLLYFFSLFVALFIIYLIGLMGRNLVGRRVMASLEKVVMKIPVFKTIYAGTKQILKAFSEEKKTFREVVLVEYPRPGITSIAFVTNEIGPYLSLFIPTTPNPTSGWLALVRREECLALDISPDDAIKLIISGGIIVPEGFSLTPSSSK